MDGYANVSELLGAIALHALLLAGIIWSLRRALRVVSERCCGLSLTALFTGLLISGLGQVLKTTVPPAAHTAIIVVALVAMVIAPILAIIGLARRQVGQAGLGPAITALSITGLLVFCVPLLISAREKSFAQKPPRAQVAVAAPAVAAAPVAAPAPAAAASPTTATVSPSAAPETPLQEESSSSADAAKSALAFLTDKEPAYVNEDLNFTFLPPPSGWEEINVNDVNPVAELSYANRQTGAIGMVIAEKVGVTEQFDTTRLSEVAQANIRANATRSKISRISELELAGIKGLVIESKSLIQGSDYYHQMWVAVNNGYTYQLTVWRRAPRRGALGEDFRQFTACFAVPDLKKVDTSVAVNPALPKHSFEFGYALIPPSPNWQADSSTAKRPKEIDFTMKLGEVGLFHVMPIPLGEASTTFEDLAVIALAPHGYEPTSPQVKRQPIRKVAGHQQRDLILTVMENQVALKIHFRLVLAPERAFVLVAVYAGEDWRAEQQMHEALDALRILAEPPQLARLTEPETRAAYGTIVNQLAIAEAATSTGRSRAAKHFQLAASLAPNDATIVKNLAEAVSEIEGLEPALAALEKLPDSGPVVASRGRVLLALGRADEAIDCFAAAPRDQLSEVVLDAFHKAALASGRFTEILAVIEEAIEEQPTVDLLRWRAITRCRAGEVETGLAELKLLAENNPEDAVTLAALVETHLLAQQPDQALAASQLVVKLLPQDPSVLNQHARVLIVLSKLAEAKRTLEKLLKLDPRNSEAAESMAYVAARLGKGESQQIREPLEPVALPASLNGELQSAASAPAPKTDGGYYCDHYVLGYEYLAGRSLKSTLRQRYRIVTQAGAQELNELSFGFDPLQERVFINQLIVRDRTGREVSRGDVDDYYVQDDEAADGQSYDQLVSAPVGGLKPGYSLEVELTREQLSSREFGFQKHFFSQFCPTQLSAVYVVGEVGKLSHRASGVRPKLTGEQIVWLVRSPPPVVIEPYQRSLSYYLPAVWINDVGTTWSQLGQEYLQDLAPVLAPTSETKQLAQQLTKKAQSSEERIAAIANYVQQELSYKALEFGVRASIPHDVATICRNRFADCKDHALVLHQLLAAVGQPSFLALVDSSNPLVTALPSLEQFDHMVVCVPRAASAAPNASAGRESWTIIDATLKSFPAASAVPPNLAGRQLLVLDPANPRLIRAGASPAASSLVRCDQQVSYVAAGEGPGGLRVEERLELAPLAAAWLREWLRDLAEGERKAAFRKLLDEDQNFELQSLKIENLEQLDQNLAVRLTYSVPDAFQEISGDNSRRLLGALPNHWAKLLVSTTRVPDRTTPFELSLPAQFVGKTTFRLASGQKLIPPTALRDEGKAACARWRRTDVVTANSLERTLIWSQTTGAFAKTEYEPYFREAQRALRSFSLPVTIDPGAASLSER